MGEAGAAGGGGRRRWLPRLWTIILVVNVLILLLPVGGIAVLRLYENELIRRTESELIAQGAFVGAAWRRELLRELEEGGPAPSGYGSPQDPAFADPDPTSPFTPIVPRLDRATDDIRSPARPARAPEAPADRWASAAGREVEPLMRQAKNTTLAGVRVVDHRGVVVATTRSELGESLAHREEVQRALSGERVTLMRERISDEPPPALESISRGTRVRVFVAMPVVEGDRVLGAVVLSRTPLDVTKALWLIRPQLAIGFFGLLVVVVAVSLVTSLTVARPVGRLMKKARRVARGEMAAAAPLESPGTFEVGQLSEALSTMAGSLADRADYIRTFAANVSHEFKTPLTSIRGTIELMQDHFDTMSAEERARFLSILERDADRLERLVRRLTELARADVIEPSGERADAAAVAAEIVERFGLDGLDVRLSGPDGPAFVPMARATLETVVANLVDNARQHGGEGVAVDVEVSSGPRRVEVAVADDGRGISEANQARVFERFFTTARASGGSGLGLSIVKALVEAHGGEVGVESELEVGTRVSVALPRMDEVAEASGA